jgi:uncharacterized protein DUF4062
MTGRRVVMISSTARDLPKHREQVRLGCERAEFEPREMMENLPALNKDAVDASLQLVEQADVYLGIFAYRYGTIPTEFDRSITEMEYDHAVKLGKPRLIFFIHKDHPVFGDDFETGAGRSVLQVARRPSGPCRRGSDRACKGTQRSRDRRRCGEGGGATAPDDLDPRASRSLHRPSLYASANT